MCGLVAIFSKQSTGFFSTDKTIFLQMLISDMFRGMDSTGCFNVNKHGNLKLIKDASPASFFIGKKEVGDFLTDSLNNAHILVGHNRKATMGFINSENAHPFIEGDICLVHNGTLTTHKELADRAIDSNAIAAHINEHGYKSALKKINGAYALIWYNAKEKTMYFTRNAERPLYLVETATKIYLASEAKMLDWILDRNNVTKYEIQNVPTDKVFKFNIDTKVLECESKPKKDKASTHLVPQNKWMPQKHQPPSWKPSSTPSSTDHTTKATIETYKSNEEIYVKCIDFVINEWHTKLVCEAQDEFNTDVVIHVPHEKYSQQLIDQLISAKLLSCTISSISLKMGMITIYGRDVKIASNWITRGGVLVSPLDIHEAGGACYCCNKALDTPESIEFAEITLNHNGSISYMLCESCADSNEHYYYPVRKNYG